MKSGNTIATSISTEYKEIKKLFWVTAYYKAEDWFIIAENAEIACEFHEAYEGFEPGIAKAIEICNVDKNYEKDEVYHAQLWMLEDLGFKVLSKAPFRVVIKDGKTYKERSTVKLVIEERFYNKEGLYIIYIANTNKYKIGITKDFEKRLLNLQTGNPNIIEVFNFYTCQNCKKIESLLHKKYKDKSIGGEWFEFTEKELDEIHKIILFLTKPQLSYSEMLIKMFS